MNILLIGYKGLKSGGPAAVMRNIKKNLEIKYSDNIDILDPATITFREIILLFFSNKIKKQNFINIDLIHLHELWNIKVMLIMIKSSFLGIPNIMTFHGVLNHWSMQKKKFIKIIFLKIFSKYIFKLSNGLHFLTQQEYYEAANYSKYIKNKAFILQNGVKLSSKINSNKYDTKKKLNLLYLGRIHPKKGIQDLISVFNLIKKKHNNIYLTIVGPKSEFLDMLKNKVSKLKLEKYIFFEKPVYEESEKRKYYIKSDFFILPSYDEADSMAIKESIGHGLPVIITKECKFEDVEKHNIGFLINHNINGIYKILIKTFKTKNYKKKIMSKNCIEFSQKNFDINLVLSNYRNLLLEIISGAKYSNNWK